MAKKQVQNRGQKHGSVAKKLAITKQKPVSKSKLKHQLKSTKHQIEQLNSNLKEFEDVRSLLADVKKPEKKGNSLDYKDLKQDLRKDEERKSKNTSVENDISKQLELLTGFEL